MKRRALAVFLIVVFALLATPAFAEGGVGVGFILGDPSGFSMVVADRISLIIGWGLANHLHVSMDVWIIDQDLENDVNWHVGLGVKGKVFNENSELTYTQREEDAAIAGGVRFPIAIQYPLADRLELFGEAAPGAEFYPGFDLDVDVGIGLRYRL